MDQALQKALSLPLESAVLTMPIVAIRLDAQNRPLPVEGQLLVTSGEKHVELSLKPISSLWRGAKVPPDFTRRPPPAYELFFFVIERTAKSFCDLSPQTDDEFERLYNHLRRRPDGRDANPLFSYLQAAAALYMSHVDVSQAEFEAVARRLTQSARRFNAGAGSMNYLNRALAMLA